jgi:hypothetical protein
VQPPVAYPIEYPDRNERKQKEIANLRAELKEHIETRQELDLSIAKKKQRLKELGEEIGEKKRAINMHYVLSDNKVGKVAIDVDSGVVLYSDLLDGVVYQKPKSVRNNTQVTSTNEETVQRDQSAKKKKVKKKQYVLDENNLCWVPK